MQNKLELCHQQLLLAAAVCSASVCFNGRDKFVDNTSGYNVSPATCFSPNAITFTNDSKSSKDGRARHLISPPFPIF
jgi:hypothetical protein